MSVLTEGQRLGAYRIVRLLGEGGMGAVYEARQEPLDITAKYPYPIFDVILFILLIDAVMYICWAS